MNAQKKRLVSISQESLKAPYTKNNPKIDPKYLDVAHPLTDSKTKQPFPSVTRDSRVQTFGHLQSVAFSFPSHLQERGYGGEQIKDVFGNAFASSPGVEVSVGRRGFHPAVDQQRNERLAEFAQSGGVDAAGG